MLAHTLDGTILVNTRNVLIARQHRDTVQVRFAGDPADTPLCFPSAEIAKSFFGRLITAIEDAEDAFEEVVGELSKMADSLSVVEDNTQKEAM
jgi:hypothetical protein